MTSRYPRIDLSGLKTISIADRESKVSVNDFAVPYSPGGSFDEFLQSLPEILAGRSIRLLVRRIASAAERGMPVVAAIGAHVVKCGLSPVIIDLIRRRVITAVATNGAGAIHDFEIAMFGQTSEDVVSGLRTGVFGMARETSEYLNGAAKTARAEGLGFGEALGRQLCGDGAPHAGSSIAAAAYECGVPFTVHACIGCDIVHMSPTADGAATGEASLRDFRILTHSMQNLGNGGVLMNIGSAVVLPEVLLKALAILLNLGYDMSGMTGVNLDFVQHYRSNQQVVARVKEIGGEGISLTGHHEIMIPLIAAGVIEAMSGPSPAGAERQARQ